MDIDLSFIFSANLSILVKTRRDIKDLLLLFLVDWQNAIKLAGRIISSCHGLLVRYTPQQVPRVCARTFISYSAPTFAKFPERISKRLLCKVRNTHGDELFGRSRAHGHVKRVHRRHMRRNRNEDSEEKDARIVAHERTLSARTRAHERRMQRRRLYSSRGLHRNYV